MDFKLFLKTAPWLPIFMLIGYAIPQFFIETNPFYGLMGMMSGVAAWIVFLMIVYVKSKP
ncbi:MAG: hypothetical protein OEL79_02820 [Chromatiales bacterium]|nr:hypothetical protein [Chromatiales bacterium]